MLRLYDYWESGNCYKVRLLLAQRGIPYERVPVDILKGETRSDAFQTRNPNQQVPLLEWPDGRCLAESNAILYYLADGTTFLPEDAWERAQGLKWLFFEQYSHEPYIAVVRFWHFAGLLEGKSELVEEKTRRGYNALQIMEKHLSAQSFFAGGRYSIADIGLYAYTHVAHEGGFDLERFPALVQWLQRVREQPGHVAITD
jgi:glutathione S-transferase